MADLGLQYLGIFEGIGSEALRCRKFWQPNMRIAVLDKGQGTCRHYLGVLKVLVWCTQVVVSLAQGAYRVHGKVGWHLKGLVRFVSQRVTWESPPRHIFGRASVGTRSISRSIDIGF